MGRRPQLLKQSHQLGLETESPRYSISSNSKTPWGRFLQTTPVARLRRWHRQSLVVRLSRRHRQMLSVACQLRHKEFLLQVSASATYSTSTRQPLLLRLSPPIRRAMPRLSPLQLWALPWLQRPQRT